ncbi:MAG TPA: hypothetical protein VMZ53_04450 [Kofleriaceae bacterium]|nr:hypothetical protein [Kofleriaceae bacterium]
MPTWVVDRIGARVFYLSLGEERRPAGSGARGPTKGRQRAPRDPAEPGAA